MDSYPWSERRDSNPNQCMHCLRRMLPLALRCAETARGWQPRGLGFVKKQESTKDSCFWSECRDSNPKQCKHCLRRMPPLALRCAETARGWQPRGLGFVKKQESTKDSCFWSECRDSNPRPLGPEPSAIPNFATPR